MPFFPVTSSAQRLRHPEKTPLQAPGRNKTFLLVCQELHLHHHQVLCNALERSRIMGFVGKTLIREKLFFTSLMLILDTRMAVKYR